MPDFLFEVEAPPHICDRTAYQFRGTFAMAIQWARWASRRHGARVSVSISPTHSSDPGAGS